MHPLVEEAYELFGSYPAPRPLDICTDCCMDPRDEERLAQMEVNQIPWDLLRRYNNEASSGHTTSDEVKHFLPRFVEFMFEDNFPSHSEEITLDRLAPFDPKDWTGAELEFLHNFSTTLFCKYLETYPSDYQSYPVALLVMFWRAEFDLGPLLEIWQSNESPESTLHFRDLWLDGFKPKHQYRLSNGFGDEQLGEKLRNWMESEPVKSAFKPRIEELVMSDIHLEDWDWNMLDQVYNQLSQP